MITINDLNNVDKDLIEERVKKYRQKLLQQHQNMIDNRKKNMSEVMNAKDNAEKEFPEILKKINERIAAPSKRKIRKVSFNCGDGLQGMFILSMLFQVLTMNGFLCSTNYYNKIIDIKW
jgi:hypothetical protein